MIIHSGPNSNNNNVLPTIKMVYFIYSFKWKIKYLKQNLLNYTRMQSIL